MSEILQVMGASVVSREGVAHQVNRDLSLSSKVLKHDVQPESTESVASSNRIGTDSATIDGHR